MIKNIIKTILSSICYIVLIPLFLILTISITWYLLPAFQTTFVGEWLKEQLPNNLMLITLILTIVSVILFFVLSRILKVIYNSKIDNFYTHFVTWLLAVVIALESIFSLIMTKSSLINEVFEFNLVRKIGILSGGVLLLMYSLLGPRLRKLIDRKIQAYDTAKELNQAGRSSVVCVQLLKALDFCFPEMVLMCVLCFAFNIQVAMHFIYILVAFILPIVGNMICDIRVKKEAIKKEEERIEAQVSATAEAVADLLEQRGRF